MAGHAYPMYYATLYQAKLDGCEFLGADLTGANMDECSAGRAGFGGAKLDGASLFHATLEGATLSNGRFRLRWHYTKLLEEAEPTGFKVYMDSGSGFDFDSPEDTVLYGFGGIGEFEWKSDPLSHGQLYRFCVRSYTTGADETQNTNYVSGIADAEGPAAVTGLITSWQEV